MTTDDHAPGADWLRALAEPQRVRRWQLADWDRAVRLLRSHRLLARLGHAVQRAGLDDAVPAPARAHLVAAMRLSAHRTQAVRWTAERLTPILAGVPGPKVLLKGAAYLALDLPIAAGRLPSDLVFMTHSLPVARGIFASCYLESSELITQDALKAIYSDFYEGSRFIRIVDGSPDINWVKTTNFCDIAVNVSGRNIAVFAAIDNLVKGAAGQAVQNMNLMFGFEETTALMMAGTNP